MLIIGGFVMLLRLPLNLPWSSFCYIVLLDGPILPHGKYDVVISHICMCVAVCVVNIVIV